MTASPMIIFLLLSFQSVDGPATEHNDPLLELSFEMDPARVSLDGGFLLRQAIKNLGEDLIYIGYCFETWRIRDLETNVSFSWRGVKSLPEEELSREHLHRLDPGVTEFSVLGAPIPIRQLVSKPGRYEMTLSCSSPVDWEQHEGVRVWNKDDDPLTTSFKFEVVE